MSVASFFVLLQSTAQNVLAFSKNLLSIQNKTSRPSEPNLTASAYKVRGTSLKIIFKA